MSVPELHEVIEILVRNTDLSHAPSDMETVQAWLDHQRIQALPKKTTKTKEEA